MGAPGSGAAVALAARAWGQAAPGGPPPLVLLHGLSGISTTYTPLAPQLAEGRAVHTLDLRGHGRSPRVPGGYVLDGYTADVVAFLEGLGRPVVLAGHSLGGVITARLAASRPDLVVAALLEDPPLYLMEEGRFEASVFARLFPLMQDAMVRLQGAGASRDEVRAVVAGAPSPAGGTVGDHLTPEVLEARVDAFLGCDPTVFDPAIAGEVFAGFDADAPIACPLTLLRADPDMGPAFLAEQEARLRAAAPQVVIHEVPGAPHGIHYDRDATDRYLGHLRQLLARAPS